MVGGMPPDAMHDILEGVLHYIVKETLKVLIFEKNLFTLDELNQRISSYDYGYHNDSNKPATIQRSRLFSADHSIKQHGNDNNFLFILRAATCCVEVITSACIS